MYKGQRSEISTKYQEFCTFFCSPVGIILPTGLVLISFAEPVCHYTLRGRTARLISELSKSLSFTVLQI